jgi:hypothetical protein
MVKASVSLHLVNLTVLMGERISHTREMLYVTAGILLPAAIDKKIGSRSVRCEQTNSIPRREPAPGPLLLLVGVFVLGGGVPLMVTVTPSRMPMKGAH